MRLVSPHARYRIVVKHQDVEILASGLPRVLAPGFIAEFKPGDYSDSERDLARKSFSFRGTRRTLGGEDIDPTDQIGTYDTSQIRDGKLRAEVEEWFLNHPDHGRDFIVADKPKLKPPWPAYDSEKAVDIPKKVADLGFDPESVIDYERENKNRPSVIEALSPKPEPEEELVAA